MTNSDICRLGVQTKDLNDAHHLLYNLSQLGYTDEQIKTEMLKKFDVLPWTTHGDTDKEFSKKKSEEGSREGTVHAEKVSEKVSEGRT